VSLAEVLVATVLTMTVMAAVLGALGSAQATVVAQSDAADERQRMRVAVETITRDLLTARDFLPFPGGILIVGDAGERTYYARGGTLRRVDGDGTDLPVVDGVADIVCERMSVNRVRVRVRMRGTNFPLRGTDVVFDVAPRNMIHGPPG
jgi:hypothetical protein